MRFYGLLNKEREIYSETHDGKTITITERKPKIMTAASMAMLLVEVTKKSGRNKAIASRRPRMPPIIG